MEGKSIAFTLVANIIIVDITIPYGVIHLITKNPNKSTENKLPRLKYIINELINESEKYRCYTWQIYNKFYDFKIFSISLYSVLNSC